VVKEIKHRIELGLLWEKASYADVVCVVFLKQCVPGVTIYLGVFRRQKGSECQGDAATARGGFAIGEPVSVGLLTGPKACDINFIGVHQLFDHVPIQRDIQTTHSKCPVCTFMLSLICRSKYFV
jgi:hypothetical protein